MQYLVQNIFLSDGIEFLKPEFQSGSSKKPFTIYLKGIQRKYTILDKKRVTKWRTVKKWLSRQESRWRVLESMLLLTSTLTSWSKFLLLGFSINVSIFSCIGATFHSLERSRWWNNAIMPGGWGSTQNYFFGGQLDILLKKLCCLAWWLGIMT